MAGGLPTYLQSFQLVSGQIGDIDVKARAFGQGMVENRQRELFDVRQARGEIGCGGMIQQAESDGWDALNGTLDGGGHGAAIDDVDAGVASVVDAAEQ